MSIVTFKDGQKRCEACGAALPAFSCTDLRKHFTCGRESCRKAVRQKAWLTVQVAEGEMACEAPGCGKPIPAGLHQRRQTRFFCNEVCQNKFYDALSPWNAHAPIAALRFIATSGGGDA